MSGVNCEDWIGEVGELKVPDDDDDDVHSATKKGGLPEKEKKKNFFYHPEEAEMEDADGSEMSRDIF